MTSDEVKTTIRNFISEEFLSEGATVTDDQHLFNDGVIDSIGVVKLTAFIEKQFGITTSPGEITMDNFSTIENIAEVVCGKLS